jgi:hypothetical protein
VNCGSFNILFAERDGEEDLNCYAEWTVVSPRDTERFHQLLKEKGWDNQNNFWVNDDALKKHNIEFTKVKQRSGDAVITNYLSPHWVCWIDVSLHRSTANHHSFAHSPPLPFVQETTQPSSKVLFNNFAYNLCPFTARFFEVLDLCNGVEQFDVEALVWRAINFLKGGNDSISREERTKIHRAIDGALSWSYDCFLQREEEIKVRPFLFQHSDSPF